MIKKKVIGGSTQAGFGNRMMTPGQKNQAGFGNRMMTPGQKNQAGFGNRMMTPGGAAAKKKVLIRK